MLSEAGVQVAKIYGNRWLVKGTLNEGGQSVVLYVEDTTRALEGTYALKRLKRRDRVARFRNEVAILQRLDDKNIVKLIDSRVQEDGSDDDSFLVMPIADGGDLDNRLSLYKDQLESVVRVALQIATALKHAHDAGVVHRDVKPANILFPTVGHDVWVSDFGLSFDVTAEVRQTQDGEVVGPRLFIAPELTEYGQREVTPSADVYSLGQVIYYMLTGGRWVSGLNVHSSKYNEVFNKGPKHTLLRLLLGKMITAAESRYLKMDSIIRELEQIENWERSAPGSLLDEHALRSTMQLQQRIAGELERKTSAEAVRRNEQDLINAVAMSATSWLAQQLEAQRSALSAGDTIVVDVYVNEPKNRRQLTVDTTNDTLLQEHDVVSIFIRPMTNKGYIAHILNFYVCSEINHKLAFEHSDYLGKPGNPAMAILPVFELRNDTPRPTGSRHIEFDTTEFIFGEARRHGISRPIPITSAPAWHRQMGGSNYSDGNVAIARFDAADWPAATSTVTEMLREVLSRVVRSIAAN